MSTVSSAASSIYDDGDGLDNNGADDVDFYALLNVPKDADIDVINKSYRQKCLIFHPDRHHDNGEKQDAEKFFVKLRKAYETLSDAKLRTIYDTVGVRGLELQGWELIPKSDNIENIRREYEFLKRLRDMEIMLQRIHPSCSFVCKTSLTGLFAADPEVRCPPQMTGMFLMQNCECSMSSSDKIGLTGRVKMSNGKGDGSFVLHWKRAISSASLFESSCTFSPDSVSLSCKFARSLFLKNAVAIQPVVQYYPLYSMISPGCAFIFSRSLHPQWQGSIIYNLGLQSSLTTTLIHTEFNLPKFVINLTVSPSNSHIRTAYTRRSIEKESFLETSCVLSLMGVAPAISYERRLSRYSRIGISLSLSLPNCLLNAKFKLKTGIAVYEYHFLLCDSEDDVARATLYGVVLPFAFFHLAKGLFRRAYDRIASFFEDRSEERQVDAIKREEAANIVNLMRRTSERIAKEEEQKHGLIIVEAKYGQMIGEGQSALAYPLQGERTIDVTVPLQAMVNDSQLRIYSGKSQLPGFYDPCPTDPKMLRVIYRYREKMHSVALPDEVALHIPMTAHRLSD